MSNTIQPKRTLTLALAATLALSACSTMGGQATDSPTSGSNAPTETVTESPEQAETETAEAEPEPEPSLTGEDPGVLALGDSFTYSDGLQVTISKPTPFTSSEWAMPDSTQALAFDIKVVNGTNAPYDPSMEVVSAQIGNTEAEQVFDSEQGFESTPMTKVLPGREVVYKVGFVGSDAKNLVLEYQPSDWERGSLIYTPNGK